MTSYGEPAVAAPSRALSDAVKEIGRMVRPELTDSQLDAAAAVIAGDVQPDAATVDPEDVRRARERIKEAIAGTSKGPLGEHGGRSLA
jgi:mono/diheme cytochrome c family protein